MTGVLSSIHRYPLKSARGEALDEAPVEPWGLAGDRRWMLVDDAGRAVTAREVNPLLLLRPEPGPTGLRLHAPGREPLDVATPDPAEQTPVALGSRSRLTAAPAGPAADAWLTDLLGRPVRLVHLDDPTRRPTDPAFSEPTDRVSLADGYPLLLTTEESLAALNDAVLAAADGAAGGREPLPMARFRPNVVVRGFDAWAEDDWRRVRIGEATFRAVKGCDRCVMTTIDPETGDRESEPVRTLARIRRYDGATWFGINLVPDVPGPPDGAHPAIRIGDAVEVLEAVEPGGGPLRNPVAIAH